jgi:hypothetical protein
MSDTATHTPGPWIACNMVHAERGDQMTPEELGEYVANAARMGDPSRFLFISTEGDGAPDICHVGNGPSGPANARLIAAAPDLLAALKGMLEAYSCEVVLDGVVQPDDDPAHVQARAAIARTEA